MVPARRTSTFNAASTPTADKDAPPLSGQQRRMPQVASTSTWARPPRPGDAPRPKLVPRVSPSASPQRARCPTLVPTDGASVPPPPSPPSGSRSVAPPIRAELASIDLEEALPLVRRCAPPPLPARASVPPPARSRNRLAAISATADGGEDPLDVVLNKARELEVIQGPLEGGAWALRVALALVPSRGALVSLLDPSRGEFLVSSTCGDDGNAPLGHRFGANDRFLALVTSSRRARAIVLADLTKLGVAFPARQMDFGWPDEVIVVPIFAGERLIAAIELIDPLAHADEAQLAALAYLAERFASFLTAHSAASASARTG